MEKLPDSIKEQIKDDILYFLPYDLFKSGLGVGYVVCTKSKVYSFENEKLILELDIKEGLEFEAESLTGSVIFECKYQGEITLIAAASRKYFTRYANLAKLLNYIVENNEPVAPGEEDEVEDPTKKVPDYRKHMYKEKSEYGLSIYKRLYEMTKPHRKLILISLLVTVLIETIAIINPIIMRVMIDGYLDIKNPSSLVRFFTELAGPGFRGFLWFVLALCLIYVVNMLFEVINGKVSNKAASNFAKDMRGIVYEKIQLLSMKDIQKRTAGELINRVTGDTIRVQNFITYDFKNTFIGLFSFIVLAIVLFITNWKMAMLVIVPVPVILIIVRSIWDRVGKLYWKVWRKWSRANSILHDILQGMRIVKAFGNEQRESKKYSEASKEWADILYKAEKFWSVMTPLMGFIITSGEFLILYLGGKYVLNDMMSLGQLIQYTSYVSMIYNPLRWVVFLPRTFSETAVSTQKLFEIIDEKSDVKDIENPIDLDIFGDISFENVSFGYKPYMPILKNISLNIKKGEMIGIVGHSGVGKSTLINLLMRLYDVDTGSIKIDGVDIKNISQHALRSQIGVVLQETFLFDGSVLENIRYAKPEADIEEVVKAAKIANAHEFIIKMPDGYNTRVGERGHSLSGGERQRIAIARAILHNPKIIILDEATASLDTITEKQIQESLKKLTQGKTTLAIAHRLSTLRNCDKLIVLDKSTLSEFGSHEELMRNKGVYYNLVMAQRKTNKMQNA